MKKQTIIMDMDEVLVNIAYKMLFKMKCNWRRYNRWLRYPDEIKTEKELYERDEFFLNKWLLKDEFKNLEKDVKEALLKRINEEMKKDCFPLNFYDDLKPTAFAKKTLLNPLYIDSNEIKKVYILSRYISEDQLEGKKDFIKKYFCHPKIEFISVSSEEKKSDSLKNLGIEWDLIIDDEIRNIKDFATEFDITKKEFLIPRFGYNKMTPELSLLIHAKGGVFNYYNSFQD